MTKKTVGYVHMEWTCPNCGTRNDGTNLFCVSCATPQPKDVAFEQVAQEKLIQDEALIARAKAGPDRHCPYCGARNPASADQCQSCLGDLSEAAIRSYGDTVGAHRTKAVADIICPACGTENPASRKRCSNCNSDLPKPEQAKRQPQPSLGLPSRRVGRVHPIVWVLLVLVVAGCGYLTYLTAVTEDTIGQVREVEWTRTVAIEGLVPVDYEDWQDEIPADAEVGFCRSEVKRTSRSFVPDSQEVCGTPYTVDTGTGVGQVVQDCEYLVYEPLCEYTVDEWQIVSEETRSGVDFAPLWPQLSLAETEREAEFTEAYRVIFDADGRSYSYRTDDLDEYLQFQPGTTWILEINGLNNVSDVRPDS